MVIEKVSCIHGILSEGNLNLPRKAQKEARNTIIDDQKLKTISSLESQDESSSFGEKSLNHINENF